MTSHARLLRRRRGPTLLVLHAGGVPSWLVNICSMLVDRGVHVVLVAPGSSSLRSGLAAIDQSASSASRILRAATLAGRTAASLARDRKLVAPFVEGIRRTGAARTWIRELETVVGLVRHGCDAIYATSVVAARAALPLLTLRPFAVEWAANEIERYAYLGLASADLAKIVSASDFVRCTSEAARASAISAGAHPLHVRVVPPGIAPIRPLEPCREVSRLRALVPADFFPDSGIEYVLRAFALLKNELQHYSVHILGEGPDLHRVLFTAAEMGLGEVVRIHGPCCAEEIVRSTDVVLDCSLSGEVSRFALEAISAAIPFVATDRDGLIADSAVVVRARDPYAIAGALRDIASDRHSARHFGKAARASVLQRHPPEPELALLAELAGMAK